MNFSSTDTNKKKDVPPVTKTELNQYIKSSNNSAKLFKLFNSKAFYKEIETLFSKNFKDGSWTNTHKPKIFNQKKFTIKKKLNSSELKKLLGNNYTNPKVNLDIDFSVSKGGYRLRPHRDDITRLSFGKRNG